MLLKPKSAWALSLGTLLVAVSLGASAASEDRSDLAQRNGCLACHAGMETKIGPSFKDISDKYASQKGAAELLAGHIVAGTGEHGVGWAKAGKATLPAMPPNGNVNPNNARKLAEWIIAAKGVVSAPERYVTEKIRISGLVEHPLELSVADLRKFPPQRIGEVPVVCQSGANLGKIENLKGVLLKDILEEAGIVTKGHNDVKKMAIIATASDDYKVVFSWTEVFNSPLGDSVIVFYERDGLPLKDDEGRIAMVSAKDTRTGPRHVKWLNGIEVRKIVD